jgi:hypothetical protein
MLRRVLWVVLALWLALGGGVFLVALNGGIGGVRALFHKEGKVAAKLRAVILVLGACLGLAVPIAVAVANGQDKARVGPAGITLTKDEAAGRVLFARTCAYCHTLAAAAADGHVGPNLDVLLPNSALVQYAIQHGFARGNGQMPAGIYSGQQATDVAQFVAAVAGRN